MCITDEEMLMTDKLPALIWWGLFLKALDLSEHADLNPLCNLFLLAGERASPTLTRQMTPNAHI